MSPPASIVAIRVKGAQAMALVDRLGALITGYADLLLCGGSLQNTQRSALEEIRRAAERGGALTHQLLAPIPIRPLPRISRLQRQRRRHYSRQQHKHRW